MGFWSGLIVIFLIIVIVINAFTDPVTSFNYAKTSLNSGKIVVMGVYRICKGLYIGFTNTNHIPVNQTGKSAGKQ